MVEQVSLPVRVALLLTVGMLLIGGMLMLVGDVHAAPKPPKTKISNPLIGCDTTVTTQTSVGIQVCAGATGLPAGFTLQWMTAAALAARGGIWPSGTPDACDASFSGNANLSRYDLAAGECVTVDIGELLFDNGTSTNCPDALDCGTDYVFRAFGHATSTLNRSDFTSNLVCGTLACEHETTCTYTQGYWKTHGPVPVGGNLNEWPVTSMALGSVTYTDIELLSILNTPAAGNGLIALAHQLIGAQLNIASGADGTAVAAAVSAANAMIGNLVIPPIGGGFLAPSVTSGLVSALTDYNEGATGPGHCD